MRQDARYSSGAKRLRAAAQNVREPLNYVTNSNNPIFNFILKDQKPKIDCKLFTTYHVNATN